MDERPNILLISDDQHRHDWVQMTGAPVQTPHLARLADEGLWYRHCYSPCPLCSRPGV